jgi:hypothetical protein
VVLLPLLGCHLFTPITIECVAGMTCARDSAVDDGDSGVIDTAGGDTGGGTVDTATVALTVGMAWYGVDAAGSATWRTFGPDGTPRTDGVPTLRAGADYAPAGPFDVDPATGDWVFAMRGPSGAAEVVAAYSPTGLGAWVALPDDDGDGTIEPAMQVELAGGQGYVLTRAAVYRFDPADGTGAIVTVGKFLDQDVPVSFGVDSTGQVHAVARNVGSGALVVLKYTPGTGTRYTNTGYDVQPNNGAARAVAVGPDDRLYVCETDGTVRLAAGDGTSLAVPVVDTVRLDGNDVVGDVSACAWDDGDASWRLFSPTRGFLHARGDSAYVLVARDATMTSVASGAFF